MGFRFYRRINILPGISLNVSKGGMSISGGVPGARLTIGPRGITRSLGIPGTGLSYRDTISSASGFAAQSRQSIGNPRNDQLVQDIVSEGGERNVTFNTAEMKEMYARIKGDPRLKLINPDTGRKFSTRELEAKIRQMELQDKVEQLQAKIDNDNRSYREVIDHWKHLPTIPSMKDVESALKTSDYVPSAPPPKKFNCKREKDILLNQII
jgi:hypothetical protein